VRLILVVVLLAGAAAAFVLVRHQDRIHEQNRLAAVASELAGRDVSVRCPGFLGSLVDVHGEAGRVQFDAEGRPADTTALSPETCKALKHLDRVDFACLDRGDCAYSEFKAGWAAHTLAHEAFHLRGYRDEAVTECYGFQNTAFVAERLGVASDRAGKLQTWLFLEGYANEPQEYQSMQCADGGALDLHPDSHSWP